MSDKIKVLVIPANENREPFTVHIPREGGLDALQGLVGGLIESAPTVLADTTVYVNEEGKLHRFPPNWRATALHPGGDVLVGDAVVCGAPDGDGYDTDYSGQVTW